MTKEQKEKKQEAPYKKRLQPVRKAHIDDITKRFSAIQTDRMYKPYNRTIRKKDRKSQQMSDVMPFSLAEASFPPPPPPMSAAAASFPPPPPPMSSAAMSAEAAEAAASQRDFEELLGMSPNDFGNETKYVDDMDFITQSFSNASLKDRKPGSLGGYRKHKSRRHKTRRHKSRRHKTRRHKTRRHKSRR